ncbi:unnamed protein product [Urochloa decumbens]|uniref:NB-ARC domain-containing protein n=1 Tax=Urochloa decumbens TaxID=240449 RepID=A0ABC9ANI7_9POAL
MGELGFLVGKYSKTTTPTTEDKRIHNLERLLLRVRVIIEEAERQLITNKAMVHQLNLLRKEMYTGYFIMDNLRCQGIEDKGHDVSHSFSLSKFNPSKRLFFSNVDTDREKDLQQVIGNLNNLIQDVNELIVFLKNYPPMYRQPYSMHLFVGMCMFGRQMEMDRIMDFLMQNEQSGTEGVHVLPIIGPSFVGKSTLVAYVCNDARVRNCFSQIMVINEDDINNQNLVDLKEGVTIVHQNTTLVENERVLVVIEFSRDVDELSWKNLYSSSSVYLGRGSRMIITSRSNKVMKFGTTQALVLNFLPLEAYWYFFKILTFGSTYSNDHPRLESMAMEIARGLNGSFMCANVTSSFLRNNFNSQFWLMYLAQLKENIKRSISSFGEHPFDLMHKNKPMTWHFSDDEFVVYDKYRTCHTKEKAPRITLEDVVSRRLKYEEEFEVLQWKSQIQPYSSYIFSCLIQRAHDTKKEH